MRNHYKRSTCRLCESTALVVRVPLGSSPIGGAFVTNGQLGVQQETYPLDLYQCLDCEHVQLLDVVHPDLVFADYSYHSGRTGLVNHFAKYADRVIEQCSLAEGSLVVDIGSNDGSFLRFFKQRGMRVLGIEPSSEVAAVAEASGVPTARMRFDEAAAQDISQAHGLADVVTANNVFAHIDDLPSVLKGVRTLLKGSGVFVFEVSYLLDVIDNVLLGAVFHEHLCYHAVKPLRSFLARHDMELIDVERVPIQGGSLICYAQHAGGHRRVAHSVARLAQLEDDRAVASDEFFRPFLEQIGAARMALTAAITDATASGDRIAAYGAARGGTLMTYLFDLGRHIEFIVDDDPHKQGTFSPGWHIPVLPVEALAERKPAIIVILAWVHSRAIIERNRSFLAAGGKFITFFPSIRVIDKSTGN